MDIHSSTQLAQTANGSLWWAISLAVIAFFLVYSAILIFHWFSFSMSSRMAVMASALYLTIGAVFVFAMLTTGVALSAL